MQIKKFNVVNPKKYGSPENPKTFWANVGTITEFHKDDGSVGRILELNDRNAKYSIFPQEKKQGYGDGVDAASPEPENQDFGEINTEDIPF